MESKFLLAFLLVTVIIIPYLFINPWLETKKTRCRPATKLDQKVPFKPKWVWIYLMAYPFNTGGILWLFMTSPSKIVQKELICYISLTLFIIIIWVLYPSRIERIENFSETKTKSIKFIKWFQKKFPPYCSFPSLHTAFSWLTAAFFLYHFGTGIGVPMIIAAGLITASTFFTKQHYFLDAVISGIIVGTLILTLHLTNFIKFPIS